jgi:carbonic anhydrase/acetyltransferase-like protein (isoleucine patch superfamily)
MNGIPNTVFVHPTAAFHGHVIVGDYSSLWASAVIRADFDRVSVGRFTSIQDNVSVHAARGDPTTIQDRAVIGKGTIVGAGAVVREGQQIPPNSIVIGVPAQVREAKPGQMHRITDNALSYAALAQVYKRGWDVTSAELHKKMMEELGPFFDPKC